MPPQVRDRYLATEVTTAPPQKLHLMLIEGAIRLVHKAQQHWGAKEDQQAAEALIRAQEIIGEILTGLNRDANPALVKQVAAIYAFILRSLVEASFQRDEHKLEGVLRVLEAERDTWRQLCAQVGVTLEARADAVPPPSQAFRAASADDLPSGGSSARFSLEA